MTRPRPLRVLRRPGRRHHAWALALLMIASACRRRASMEIVTARDDAAHVARSGPRFMLEVVEPTSVVTDDDAVVVATKHGLVVLERVSGGWSHQTLAARQVEQAFVSGKLVAAVTAAADAASREIDLWRLGDGHLGRRPLSPDSDARLTAAGVVISECGVLHGPRGCTNDFWNGRTTRELPDAFSFGGGITSAREGLYFAGTVFMEVPSGRTTNLTVPGGSDVGMFARGELGTVFDATSDGHRTLWFVPRAEGAPPERLLDRRWDSGYWPAASSRLVLLGSIKEHRAHVLELSTRRWRRFDLPPDALSFHVAGTDVVILMPTRVEFIPFTAVPGLVPESIPEFP